jgi:hypothetical protein
MGEQALAFDGDNQKSILNILKNTRRDTDTLLDVMIETVDKIEYLHDEMKLMHKEIKDEVTLSHAEVAKLKDACNQQANFLANLYFDHYRDDSDGDYQYMKKLGYVKVFLWRKLKNKFKVPKYLYIRRVDNEQAIDFLLNVDLTSKEIVRIENYK